MTDKISPVFSALADPTRRAMLAQLALGEATVSDLAAPYKMSLPAASKHISVLTAAGLVRKKKRGRTVACRLAADPLRRASDWLARYHRFWSDQLDALDRHLANERAQGER